MTTAVPDGLQPGDLVATHITGSVGFWIGIGEFINSVRWKTLFSRTLQELRVFSHIAVYVGSGNVVEAEPGKQGARVAPLSEYLDGRPIMFSTGLLGVSPETGQKIAARALASVGIKYFFLDYLALLLRRLHVPLRWVKKRLESDKTEICSQLATACYTAEGVILFPKEYPWEITPLDIAELLVSKGATP